LSIARAGAMRRAKIKQLLGLLAASSWV